MGSTTRKAQARRRTRAAEFAIAGATPEKIQAVTNIGYRKAYGAYRFWQEQPQQAVEQATERNAK